MDEMHELQAFASARGVFIIGELDVPGHATAIVNALPGIFGFPSQHNQVGIINLVNESTVKALQNIFDEIHAVFPSPYVHCGGDEVNFGTLDRLPEVQAAIKTLNFSSSTDVYRRFIVQMHQYAQKTNRTLIVWEGFAPSEGQSGRSAHPPSNVSVPTDIIVTPFDCFYYPPPQLAADGYKVLNSAWSPLYIAGGAGMQPEMIYRWNPYLFGEVHSHLSWWTVPKEHRAQVIGVKMSVWQTSAQSTLCALASRLPAMSDRSWFPQAGRTFVDYQVRASAATRLLATLLAEHRVYETASASLPTPAAPGFVGGAGACRDKNGEFGTRLEHNGPLSLAQCQSACLSLDHRLDAYDWGFSGDDHGVWCGCWGSTFAPTDNQTIEGLSFTFANGSSVMPVCRALPQHRGDNGNFCYVLASLHCKAAAGPPELPGCSKY